MRDISNENTKCADRKVYLLYCGQKLERGGEIAGLEERMDKTKIVIFGMGNNGRRIMDAYGLYDVDFEIVAIADNHSDLKEYASVRVIAPDEMNDYEYDEVWIASIYHREIKKQLVEELHIASSRIRYVEYPMIFLERVIYDKYREEIAGNRRCISAELQQAVDYIADNGVRMYCYPFYDEYINDDISVYYDEAAHLYYGVCFGRRMYLSRQYDTPEKAKHYLRYVCLEQDKRSPHRYLTEHFQIEKGDVGIDVGAAEGIFALQVIGNVEHIYLIEADADWCEALKVTFRDDSDKVTIIQGYVSDTDQGSNLSLDKTFANKKINFIKMDIEGAEVEALRGAERLIEKCRPKLAVCTYHNAEDEKKIRAELEATGGYTVRHSPGYVICQGEWELEHIEEVDFRRALLWAERD